MIYLTILSITFDFISINNELTAYIRHQIVFQVSWLRHRNPIPQVLGMNNQIYVKDPRFSVFHNSADPKSKEVGRDKIIEQLIHKFELKFLFHNVSKILIQHIILSGFRSSYTTHTLIGWRKIRMPSHYELKTKRK